MPSDITPIKLARRDRAARVMVAIEMCREISERARAMKLGLVAYPVDDVELLIAALTEPAP
jgi:hypothetical protein